MAPLEVTANDIKKAGKEPSELEMIKNPTKTRAELMTDGEIVEYLRKRAQALKEIFDERLDNVPALKSVRERDRKGFVLNLRYLKEIGRLPEEFKSFYEESEKEAA